MTARERPILFNGAMVRAILAGAKTQTRRALRDQNPVDLGAARHGSHLRRKPMFDSVANRVVGTSLVDVNCPFGQPGDRLWVRETHAIFPTHGQHRADGERWGPWGGLPTTMSGGGKQFAFRDLWTSTGGDWGNNPWVWVIEFKRVEVAGG
ncbi:hypothetical protein [Stenotrophomonas sp. CFBP 13725]|uniref:hypothetical protein n=1 Tax=Stenotrophomonas sp. CFBP 13725 TaxID=2775297 RepID=UPI00178021ED|nr:hypothetical protein [Stenotrophomonas sp. CFBP 13725]MBD8634764.1 hypothetical protein [Stenotrophomonas sp. CFBP 13725]